MITGVAVNSQPLDPGAVLAEVTVLHGRRAATDPPTASAATIVVEHPPGGMPPWRGGDIMELTSPEGPVFSGRIAERSLTHRLNPDGSTTGVLTVTAMGAVARLGLRTVGDEPWPAEPGSARADRILSLAEVPYLIDGPADAAILPRDVDSRPALDLLTDLARSTAAAVFDLPDGRVVYQPLKERARPVRPFRWQDFTPETTWADLPPEMTWADFDAWHSADSEFPVAIPAAAVTFEPAWAASESDVVNHFRVGYGPTPQGSEQPWTELWDDASVAAHGRRYQYLGTQLVDLADAQDYASWRVAVGAWERWALDDVTVHPDLLDPPTRATVMALTCGDHITIGGMPQPAPAIEYQGIVEGWTYSMWGASGDLFEQIILHTSALLESLAVPTWADHTPEHEWQDYSPMHTWADLTDLASIGA